MAADDISPGQSHVALISTIQNSSLWTDIFGKYAQMIHVTWMKGNKTDIITWTSPRLTDY